MQNKSYRVKQCSNCKAKNIIARPESETSPVLVCSKCGIPLQAKTRKRQKQVYDTGQIPHLWFWKTQPSARNKQGNLYFENGTVYSYGSHFPIAAHVTNKRGRKAILFTARGYSNTTSGHKSAVRSAIPKNVPVFEVSDVPSHDYWGINKAVERMHADNLKAYLTDLTDRIEKARKARTLWAKKWKTGSARGLRDEIIRYGRFFTLKLPDLPEVPKLTAALVRKLKARETFLASDGHKAVLVVERARREMNADFARRRAAADAIAEWRIGNPYVRLPWDIPTMLRIRGQEVETSIGARVPVSHAKRVLKVVRSVVASGQEFVSNGHKLPVGVYRIDRIEPSGLLHAGCHHITLTEIEAIAPQLEATPNELSAEVLQ